MEWQPSAIMHMYSQLGTHSSRGGTRTPDRVINSHLLYHLSYPGMHP